MRYESCQEDNDIIVQSVGSQNMQTFVRLLHSLWCDYNCVNPS